MTCTRNFLCLFWCFLCLFQRLLNASPLSVKGMFFIDVCCFTCPSSEFNWFLSQSSVLSWWPKPYYRSREKESLHRPAPVRNFSLPPKKGVTLLVGIEMSFFLRKTLSIVAGNSMTGSERPSPEPLLKSRGVPSRTGGEKSGNALEASNALNYWVWGIPAVLSRAIPGNALRAFPGSFRIFSENFFRKAPTVLGVWPIFRYREFSSSFRYRDLLRPPTSRMSRPK